MTPNLRIMIADDERPARSFLLSLLRGFPDVEVVGEATNGPESIKVIEAQRPDLALLDLQMPEIDGLGVVSLLKRESLPLIAFVTAYDEYAVRAFELNAIDYLLKPVDRARLRDTLHRARERLESDDLRDREADRLNAAADEYESHRAESNRAFLERIPIRQRDEIVLLPVDQVASVIADGDLLNLTTVDNRRYSFSYRLKDLESRLDPARFVRLARGTLAKVDQIERISPLPGGTYLVRLLNKQELNVSRSRARVIREQLLKL